jgi:hypothetical protein
MTKLPYTVQEPPQRRSTVFRPLLKSGTFDQPATFKAWEEDRARLILGLANWTILTWHSPWTAVPCCCGIRFLQMSSGAPRQYTFAAEEHKDCRNQSLGEHKTLLLGLAIAELLTGCPLRLPHDHVPGKHGSANEHRVFMLESWQKGGGDGDGRGWDGVDWPTWKWRTCSRDEILADVSEKSSKSGLKDVVEYCLDHPSRSGLTSGGGGTTRTMPDVLPMLVENVLIP